MLTTSPFQIAAIGAACAFVGPLWNVVVFSYASLIVPNDLLGRVMSAGATVTWGFMPVASLGAGLLLAGIGARGTIGVLAVLMAGAALTGSLSSAIRAAPALR